MPIPDIGLASEDLLISLSIAAELGDWMASQKAGYGEIEKKRKSNTMFEFVCGKMKLEYMYFSRHRKQVSIYIYFFTSGFNIDEESSQCCC